MSSESDPADLDLDFELLRELTETGGVPGYEDRIREIVRRELRETTDAVRSDGTGNVVGTLAGGDGNADYEVVAAHMGELGEKMTAEIQLLSGYTAIIHSVAVFW